jgi:hypothetical protein
MFSSLNFSHKNLKENTPQKMMVNHYSRMENMKKKNAISLKKSLELSKNADANKIQNVSKIMSESSEAISNNINTDTNNIEINLYESNNINNLIDKLYENKLDENEITLANTNAKFEIQIYDNTCINTQFIEQVQDFVRDGTEENYIVPYNVERIRKKGITIINNVYQSKYNFGKTNATGLGDFIRGCYFVLEFCEQHNFEYKIIFNNDISKFLKIKTYNIEYFSKIFDSIIFFQKNNLLDHIIKNNFILEPMKNNHQILADFVEYIVSSTYYNGNTFICNNTYPMYEIQEKHKIYMKKVLEPSDEMKGIINARMQELNITFKQYIVIHVRCGDSYLKQENSEFKTKYLFKLVNSIKEDINNINNDNNTYLLISDNNEIKYMLHSVFPNFRIFVNPITHFGEGVALEEENVKNTLTDFYLISFSKYIYAYSVYKHGSGFSYWSAKTFGVPYFCKYIE